MNIFKKLLLNPYTLFSLAITLGIVLLYTYILNPVPAEIGQVIGSKTILNEKGELEIKYAYVSGKIDSAISKNVQEVARKNDVVPTKEEIRERTSNSRTFSTNKEGVSVTEFLSGPEYFKDDKGNWWQADYKTTTPEEFSKLPKTPLYARLTDDSKFALIKKAFATTSTFYPAAGTGGTGVDGYIVGSDASWATLLAATAGSSANTGTGNDTVFVATNYVGGVYTIRRAIFSFDTSAIPNADSISSATFSLIGRDGGYEFTDNQPMVRVVGATPASTNDLVVEDFDQLGTTQYVDTPPTNAQWIASANIYVNMTLNASGIAAISKTSNTYLAVRSKMDLDGTPAPVNGNNYISTHMADSFGTANDPKLVVVHSVVPSTGSVFKQGIIFKQGVIFK
ncbi:MAG: hypothetical protein WCT29_00075 [Candidatus Paceibacterota bacterium]|jgi:hypothetical protein